MLYNVNELTRSVKSFYIGQNEITVECACYSYDFNRTRVEDLSSFECKKYSLLYNKPVNIPFDHFVFDGNLM